MSVSTTRVRAIFRKELREYRRNRSIVVRMAIMPLIFLIQPLIAILTVPASSAGALRGRSSAALPAGHPGARAGRGRRLRGGRRA